MVIRQNQLDLHLDMFENYYLTATRDLDTDSVRLSLWRKVSDTDDLLLDTRILSAEDYQPYVMWLSTMFHTEQEYHC